MTRSIVLFAGLLGGLVLSSGAAGQGTSCRNGMCPSSGSTAAGPIEARVYSQQEMGAVEKKIVELEKAALEKWYAGDPSAYIGLLDENVGYFEPILEKRLDGRGPLTKIYEALRGKVRADTFDMLNTRVQASDKMAVLSFNLVAVEGGIPFRWNCTEVFELKRDDQWKLIHSHWSETKPQRCPRQ